MSFSLAVLVAPSTFAQDGSSPPTAPTEGEKAKPAEAAKPTPGEGGKAAAGQGGDSDLSSADAETGSELKSDREDTGKSLADRIDAVSRRVFVKRFRFEAAPTVGFSINDGFYQRINAGARFSFHIFEALSIDGGGAINPIHIPLPTVRFLQEVDDQFIASPIFWGYGDIGLTFAPIYGKFSLMSEMVVHFDMFVSGGVGFVVDSNRYFLWGQAIPSPFIPNVSPAAEIGVGGRVFLFKWFAIRLDVRDYIYPHNVGPKGFALQNTAMLNLSASFWFPFDFEYAYQEGRK